MISCLNVKTISGGGLVINGIMLASYHNLFMFIMAFLMMISGVLLTALAYRPKEMGEEWMEWTERFCKSRTSRVAGPLLTVLGLLLNLLVLGYCLLKRKVKNKETRRNKEESTEAEPKNLFHKKTGSWKAERRGLLTPNTDIACFPVGSLR